MVEILFDKFNVSPALKQATHEIFPVKVNVTNKEILILILILNLSSTRDLFILHGHTKTSSVATKNHDYYYDDDVDGYSLTTFF